MLNLPNVTLIAVDDVNPYRCIDIVHRLANSISFGDVKVLSSFDVEGATPIDPVFTIQAYNLFIAQKLYHYVATEFCIVFQWDGYPVNPAAWQDTYLTYDYIGAPWIDPALPLEQRVGNGGFSLRSKKFLQTTSTIPYDGRLGEDLFFCRLANAQLREAGIKFATPDVAYRFSVENMIYSGSFGFHGFRTILMSKKAGTLA